MNKSTFQQMLTKNIKVFENIVALKKTLWKKGKKSQKYKSKSKEIISRYKKSL